MHYAQPEKQVKESCIRIHHVMNHGMYQINNNTYFKIHYPKLKVPLDTLYAAVYSNGSVHYILNQECGVRTYLRYVLLNRNSAENAKMTLESSLYICEDTEVYSVGECHEVTGFGHVSHEV